MSLRHLPPDRPRNDIARSELGAGHVSHEAIAVFVDEHSAFAAHGFADELQRTAVAVERRRVELDEFEIAHDGAGARGECQSLAERSRRIGAVQEQAADAAGRDDDAIGREQHGPLFGLAEQPGHRIVFDDQAARRDGLDDRDRGVSHRPGGPGSRMISRPVASPPAWTMRRREWAASRPRRELPSPSRSKRTPRRANRSIAAGAAATIAAETPRRKARRRPRAYRPDAAKRRRRRPMLAAMPPCASTLEASKPSGALVRSTHRLRRQRQRRHQARQCRRR